MEKRPIQVRRDSVPRVRRSRQGTGKAKFVGRHRRPRPCLRQILRTRTRNARNSRDRPDRGRSLPGVVAVLTAADFDDLTPIYNGRPIIAMHKVRYVGEPVRRWRRSI